MLFRSLLNKGIRVSLPFPPNGSVNKLGLYFRSTKGWVFQTARPDSDAKYISTEIDRTLGDVALLQDTEPPSFGLLRVYPRYGKPYISFRYYDNLSGIDTDEIKMYIDDKQVIPEIDGERRYVWFQAEQRLELGKHTLVLAMKDRMNNESTLTRAFTIR